MAQALLQGRAVPCPLASYSSVLPCHSSFLYGNLSSALESLVPLDSEAPPYRKETSLASARKRLKSCRGSALPQRPFGEQHRSRQDVGGRAGKEPDLNSLKQPKHVPASLEFTPPFPLMRSTTLEQSSVCNILSTPSHLPSTSFLSHQFELQDDALVISSDDEEFIKGSSFSIALVVCAAVQLVNITDALSLWVSRLRLRYFDSPFTYRDDYTRTKVGRIGIFWDIENCPIPGSLDARMVVKQMHRIGASFGAIQCLRAYGKLEYLTRQAPSLLSMGVELCPVPDGKESADKAIIMDALLFALDHKPCPDTPPSDKFAGQASQGDGIVLVTGDRGFCALVRELSNRQMTTVVIGNGHQKIPPILAQAADFSIQWDEMMESSHLNISCIGRHNGSMEVVSILEDEHLEFGGLDASSSCNVLLKYESSCNQVEERIPPSCDRSHVVEGCEDVETLVPHLQDGIASIKTSKEDAQGINFSHSPVSQQIGFSANGHILCRKYQDLDLPATDSKRETCAKTATDNERDLSPNISFAGKETDVTRKQVDLECSYNLGLGLSKSTASVGGRVRILRHLRCEVAYVVEKYCKGEPKAAMTFEQFELLYKLEMGHLLVSSHYGFATLKSLLQSMPDIVCVCSISSETPDWRISPYIKKNGCDRKARTNFSRQDLRCILYKILHSHWPHGVPKDYLSSEHCKLTGRPLVLVGYEYWKLSDLVQTMGDMMYIDDKNKNMYLLDGTPEPHGLHEREQDGWN